MTNCKTVTTEYLMKEEMAQHLIRGVSYDAMEQQELPRGVFYEVVDDAKLVSGVFYEKEEPKAFVKGVSYDVKDCTGNEACKNAVDGEAYLTELRTVDISRPKNMQVSLAENLIQKKSETPVIEVEELCKDSLNFKLKLERRIARICDTAYGEKISWIYCVSVFVSTLNGKVEKFEGEVDSSKIKDIAWLKRVTHSYATLPKDKEQKGEFENKVQAMIENTEAPVEIIYPNAGWRKISGYWKYVFATGVVGNPELLVHTDVHYSLDVLSDRVGNIETFKDALSMCNICRSKAASTEIFLFFHATLLTQLFELAGYPLSFVFGVAGVTNSRKTSMVTTMAKLFDRKKLVADAEFATATACGIEKELARYKDAVVLIDDLKPGINMAQQRELARKLDELLRFYGNRVSKKRMTDFMNNGEEKFFPIGGGCIVTMEVVDGIMSSLSRMFYTEIDNTEVINERLNYYQINRWILPTHTYDFLAWVTENFECCVTYLAENFDNRRKCYISQIGRYSEMYATLTLVAEIIVMYAEDRRFFEGTRSQMFVNECGMIISGELARMELRIKTADKANIAVSALRIALDTRELIPVTLTKESCKNNYAAYEDECFYYIQARLLLKIAIEYCRKFFINVTIVNENELILLFERLGILEVLKRDGRKETSRKLPIQRGNHQRYLYLDKRKLFQLEE